MSTLPETLRALLAEASLDWDESKSGPGRMEATATKDGGAELWHSDFDLAAVFGPYTLIDPMALASLVASALPALPLLLDVVEKAGELVAGHEKRDGIILRIDVDSLREALAALNAPAKEGR